MEDCTQLLYLRLFRPGKAPKIVRKCVPHHVYRVVREILMGKTPEGCVGSFAHFILLRPRRGRGTQRSSQTKTPPFHF